MQGLRAVSRYIWMHWRRSAFPQLIGVSILLVSGIGLFLSALAWVEQTAVFESWCMTLWRVVIMASFVLWHHHLMIFQHEKAYRAWWMALQRSRVSSALGGILVGTVIHLLLVCICALLGLYGTWMIGGMTSTSFELWCRWSVARILECILLGGVLLCMYHSQREVPSLYRHGYAALSTLLIYMIGCISPWLLLIFERVASLKMTGIGVLKQGFELFFRMLPPFYLLDDWSHGGVYPVLYILSYAVLLTLYGLKCA